MSSQSHSKTLAQKIEELIQESKSCKCSNESEQRLKEEMLKHFQKLNQDLRQLEEIRVFVYFQKRNWSTLKKRKRLIKQIVMTTEVLFRTKESITSPNSIYIKVGFELSGYKEYHIHAYIDT